MASDTPKLVLSLPNTLFTNNDGGAEPSDIVPVVAGLVSPEVTNGTLTLSLDVGTSVKVWTSSNRTERVSLPDTWDASLGVCRVYYVEGAHEMARGGDAFRLTWRGETGAPLAATNVQFAVYHPVANVINSTLYDGGDLCNPCGIVTGTNACFALEFGAVHPPPDEIVWTNVEGIVSFVGGVNTGERVRVASDTADQLVRLRAQIGDCRSRPVEMTAFTVDPLQVKLTIWIVGDDEKTHYATDEASVINMVNGVNKIYEQIGVSFYIDSISRTNRTDWLDLSEGDSYSYAKLLQLTSIESNTGGLELYFINTITSSGPIEILAGETEVGILVSSRATAKILAHELAHSFGCGDIFCTYKTDSRVRLQNRTVCEDHCYLDWNNGSGCRYYKTGVKQEDLIRRMLLWGFDDGTSAVATAIDMTNGSVHGYTERNEEGLVDVGFFTHGTRRAVRLHH